jgi:hypothetical protein
MSASAFKKFHAQCFGDRPVFRCDRRTLKVIQRVGESTFTKQSLGRRNVTHKESLAFAHGDCDRKSFWSGWILVLKPTFLCNPYKSGQVSDCPYLLPRWDDFRFKSTTVACLRGA